MRSELKKIKSLKGPRKKYQSSINKKSNEKNPELTRVNLKNLHLGWPRRKKKWKKSQNSRANNLMPKNKIEKKLI